jgi:hypothetical protein
VGHIVGVGSQTLLSLKPLSVFDITPFKTCHGGTKKISGASLRTILTRLQP